MGSQGHGAGTTGRRDLGLVAGVAATALFLLGRVVTDTLAVPRRPAGLVDWATGVDPALLAVGLLCACGLLLAVHALAVVLLALLADLLRVRPLARLASALALGPVRAVVVRASGAALGTGLVLVPSVAGAAPLVAVPTATTTLGTVVAPSATVEIARPLPALAVRVGTARPLPPAGGDAPGPDEDPRRVGSSEGPIARSDGPRTRPAAAGDPDLGEAGSELGRWRRVTVRPGDHLWGLAERDVAAHVGGTPDEATVRRHWASVVEANRDRLVVPGDPDLVLPDQHLLLPPVEGA